MNSLKLEFKRSKTKRWMFLGLAMAALVATLAGAAQFAKSLMQQVELQQQTQGLQVKVDRLEQQLATLRAEKPYQIQAEKAVRIAQFPLEGALAELEAVSTPGVRIRSLAIQPADSTATATLESISSEKLMEHLEKITQAGGGWELHSIQSGANAVSSPPETLKNKYGGAPSQMLPPPPPAGLSAVGATSGGVTATLTWIVKS